MKKINILCLLATIFALGMTTSCKNDNSNIEPPKEEVEPDKPNPETKPDDDNKDPEVKPNPDEGDKDPEDKPNPDEGDKDPETKPEPPKELVLSDFDDIIHNSKPTKVHTYITYFVPTYDISLNFTSLLSIEYGPVTKAEYVYSYQKLNPIGSPTMISTYNGVCYAKGNKFGELNGDTIIWNLNVESDISLLNFKLTDKSYDSMKINDNVLTLNINDTKNKLLFGMQYGKDMKNTEMTIKVDKDKKQVNNIDLVYDDVLNDAQVILNTNYFYEDVIVSIPE